MLVRILGSAAGGGFPQWNCNCPNCRGVRSGSSRWRARAQSSIAVRGANAAWALVNASPDVLRQIATYDDLHPTGGVRGSSLSAIVLMDGQIDHVTGLLMLREHASAWPLWCTETVRAELTNELRLLPVLGHYCGVEHRPIEIGRDFIVDAVENVAWRAIELTSKAPPYSSDRAGSTPGSNIALSIRNLATNQLAVYAPGVGVVSPALWEHAARADVLLIDGTCWDDDDLARLGISERTARAMGHLPLNGTGGMLEWLARLPASTRKVLTHINNTNPILDSESPQRARLHEMGIEVGFDGMEFQL